MKPHFLSSLIYVLLVILLIPGMTPHIASAADNISEDSGSTDAGDSDSVDSNAGTDGSGTGSSTYDSIDDLIDDLISGSDGDSDDSSDDDSTDDSTTDDTVDDSTDDSTTDDTVDDSNDNSVDDSTTDDTVDDSNDNSVDDSSEDSTKDDSADDSKEDSTKDDSADDSGTKNNADSESSSSSSGSSSRSGSSSGSNSSSSSSSSSGSNSSSGTTSNSSSSSNSGSSSDDDSGPSSMGSGISTEKVENIDVKELATRNVISGYHIEYNFTENVTCITHIEYDSIRTFRKTTAIVEVLKGKSTLVKTLPQGEIYKHVNIWVGENAAGLPTSLENGLVGFRVEKDWIENNNISESNVTLQWYNKDEGWKPLDTKKTGEDERYFYFESQTPGYSSFAITEYNAEEENQETQLQKTLRTLKGGENGISKEPMKIAKTFLAIALPLFMAIAGYGVLKKKI